MDHSNHSGGEQSSSVSRANIVLIGFLVLAGFYLVTDHWAHLLGWLPWLLLLACPLMHFFMHGGHGGHGGRGDSGSSNDRQSSPHQH